MFGGPLALVTAVAPLPGLKSLQPRCRLAVVNLEPNNIPGNRGDSFCYRVSQTCAPTSDKARPTPDEDDSVGKHTAKRTVCLVHSTRSSSGRSTTGATSRTDRALSVFDGVSFAEDELGALHAACRFEDSEICAGAGDSFDLKMRRLSVARIRAHAVPEPLEPHTWRTSRAVGQWFSA